mmetsp:Transcript_17975/g.35146  ORF Transcript_17975/g.35146 Transcript_17975/m.35146 type:complete len:1272 (+) Transcript_17975:118-3933(+)
MQTHEPLSLGGSGDGTTSDPDHHRQPPARAMQGARGRQVPCVNEESRTLEVGAALQPKAAVPEDVHKEMPTRTAAEAESQAAAAEVTLPVFIGVAESSSSSDARKGPSARLFPEGLKQACSRKSLAHHPLCCSLCSLAAVLLVTGGGMVALPPSVNSDFSVFMKTDVAASVGHDVLAQAKRTRTQHDHRRLSQGIEGSAVQHHVMFTLTLLYELIEGTHGHPLGIMDPKILFKIAHFERRLRSISGWSALCSQVPGDQQRLCNPGVSVAVVALPTQDMKRGSTVPTALRFEGSNGQDMLPNKVIDHLLKLENLEEVLLPRDRRASDPVLAVRSVFRFMVLCCNSHDSAAKRFKLEADIKEQWSKFSGDSLLPVLSDAVKGRVFGEQLDADEWPFRVYFRGTGMLKKEFMEVLTSDIKLAAASSIFVLIYMFLHLRSLFLSIVGLFVMVLSVPLAYVVFAAITGITSMNVASFLSLFLIVGLGCDSAFVYSDFWHQSANIKAGEAERLIWTLQHAGKSTFASTFTTSISFLANLASVLRALREFGLFMGLCVLFVWILLTLIFLPFCAVSDRRRCSFGRFVRAFLMANMGLKRLLFRSDGEVTRPESGLETERTVDQAPVPEMQDPKVACWEVTSLYKYWARSCGRVVIRMMTCFIRFHRVLFLMWVICALTALIWAVAEVRTDAKLLNLFPPEHNQNRGNQVNEMFVDMAEAVPVGFKPPKLEHAVCQENAFKDSDSRDCVLFWCDTSAGKNPPTAPAAKGSCQCFRQTFMQDSCSGSPKALILQRYAWSRHMTEQDLGSLSAVFLQAANGSSLTINVQPIAPIVVQDWELGDVNVQSLTEVKMEVAKINRGSQLCGWTDLCFCELAICRPPAPWTPVPPLVFGAHPSQGSRRLVSTGPRVKLGDRVSVQVVFGLKIIGSRPMFGDFDPEGAWEFAENHQPQEPWAQRNMFAFCVDTARSELQVVEAQCWIENFRDYMKAMNEPFPVLPHRFHAMVSKFAVNALIGFTPPAEFLWFENGKLKASVINFWADVSKKTSAPAALAYSKTWDSHLAQYNAQASRFANNVWHSSSLWVVAEAQRELLTSTVLTLGLTIALAFIAMIIFTRSLVLSFFVVVATSGVISGLAFFMVVIMRWPVGPVEVISLIFFIGYAVTYSLHVAHRYSSPDAIPDQPEEVEPLNGEAVRRRRTEFALRSIGGATLGSAITTGGAACFLMAAQLTLFGKLGGVVLVVTLLSVLTALVPLPAALLWLGPVRPRTACKLRFQKLRSVL